MMCGPMYFLLLTGSLVSVFALEKTIFMPMKDAKVKSVAKCPQEEKVWTIGLTTDDRGVSDPTEDTGDILAGAFEKAMIPKVCAIAGKTCKIVGVQNSQCNGNKRGRGFPGEGLLSGFFDACARFVPTLERMAGLKFTLPYSEEPKIAFYVLYGNPTNFKLHNCGDHTVGVKDGYLGSPQCLNRNKKIFKEVISLFTLDLVKALKNGDVDAIAIEVNGPDEKKDLEMIGKPFTCAEGGISMFTLKSNTFVQWWNPAFKTLVKSGQYHKLCKKVKNADWPCVMKISKAIKSFEMNPALSHKSA